MKQSWARFAVLVVATAAVWLLSGNLPWPSRLLTTLLAVPLPAFAISQARVLETLGPESLPRVPVYLSSLTSLWLLGALAVMAAAASGFTSALTGLRTLPLASFALWTLAGIAAAGLLYAITRALGLPESRLLLELLPRTRLERIVFVLLSITAGICEEFVFRGFLIPALTVVVGGSLVAAAIAAVIFGALHAYQGWLGALRAGVLGAALAVPLIATGSIFPSMAAHTLIDIIGGLWLARRMMPAAVSSAE